MCGFLKDLDFSWSLAIFGRSRYKDERSIDGAAGQGGCGYERGWAWDMDLFSMSEIFDLISTFILLSLPPHLGSTSPW